MNACMPDRDRLPPMPFGVRGVVTAAVVRALFARDRARDDCEAVKANLDPSEEP